MPVRKIPKNHLVVTGSFAGHKTDDSNGFESLLEKEYLLLLDFDEEVLHYEVQPVNIPVPGVPKGYTPDVLVKFRPNPFTNLTRRSLLVEVKTAAHLIKYEEKYKAKFASAEDFAQERDWEFRKITEIDIRTPRLANLKFLREYRNIEPSSEDLELLMKIICSSSNGITAEQILLELTSDCEGRLYWLPIIWHALVCRHISADLESPLNHNSLLFPN